MSESFKKAFQIINNANKIAIFTHANVDGDAIGSAFAFYFYLKGLNKEVDVFSKTTMPNQLKFLNVEELINKKSCSDYDLAISVDCNTAEMMNIYTEKFFAIENTLQFDHHPKNPQYAKFNVTDDTRSSACELIAEFFISNDVKLNEKVASFLLTGIITDSGGFKFSNTSKRTMEIVGRLLSEYNLELHYLMSNLFESEEPSYLELYREAINNTKLIEDNKIALIVIPNSFYKRTGIDPNSAKNLTRIGTEIKDVIVTALIAEVESGMCKISFRSRGGYDCSECARVFGGGGHKQASGCKVYGNLYDIVDKVTKSIMDGLV